MIVVGSKCKLKGKQARGVSFKVISINRWDEATIEHSLSKKQYVCPLYELELMKKNEHLNKRFFYESRPLWLCGNSI